jgi:steroid delta-isomerase-like uncharacterized protein
MADNLALLRRFMEQVWNTGNVARVDDFLAETYTIHSDPGDPWNGQTLNREAFKERLIVSRTPFPDLRFELGDAVSEGDRVAICWTMVGTQTGPMAGRPATGRPIRVQGMTVYFFSQDRITGHRQVVDRLSVAQQLGLLG